MQKIQLAPLIEVVWAKVKDGAPWPALVIEGTLRNSYCKKLKVFHLLHMATYHVLRNAVSTSPHDTRTQKHKEAERQ